MDEKFLMVAQVDKFFIKLSLKKTFTRLVSYVFYEGRPLTTKGRWINPFVFLLYRIQSFLPFEKKVYKPIFILGTGRSGTTILGVTLGIHQRVGFLNEPKALWSFLHDHEDLIGSYQKLPGRYRLDEKDSSLKMVKRARRIYGNYLRFSLSSRVVDKYPELIFRVRFVMSAFPDAKFLFLFRDGNDTCRSIGCWSERLGTQQNGEIHDWWGRDDQKWNLLCDQIVANDSVLGEHIVKIKSFKDQQHRAAVEWIVTMKEGLSLVDSQPDSVMPVKYEEYIASDAYRSSVLKFCNLEPDLIYNKYCYEVLNPPKKSGPIKLPVEIEDEFNRVMTLLSYYE